jgi:hypothetical protein
VNLRPDGVLRSISEQHDHINMKIRELRKSDLRDSALGLTASELITEFP